MTLRQYIAQWVERLSMPRPEFNEMPPCPYAQRATLAVCTIDDVNDLSALLEVISLKPLHVMVIRLVDPTDVYRVLSAHRESLASRDIVALDSDPQHPIEHKGAPVFNGLTALWVQAS